MRKGFEGYIRFNELQFADRVSLVSTGFSFHFSPQGRNIVWDRRIGIYPFPASALLIGNPKRMSEGFYYTTQGTEVGACSQGPGHPDGGDTLSWPITEFTIAAKYSYEMLTLGVSGRTQEGCRYRQGSPVESSSHEELEPYTFRLEVRIPREAIADTLGLSYVESVGLYEALELCR